MRTRTLERLEAMTIQALKGAKTFHGLQQAAPQEFLLHQLSNLKVFWVLVLFFSVSTLVRLVFIPDSAFLFLLGLWEDRLLCSNGTASSQNGCNACLPQRKDVQLGFLTEFVCLPPRYCSYWKVLFPRAQKSLHLLQPSLHFIGH